MFGRFGYHQGLIGVTNGARRICGQFTFQRRVLFGVTPTSVDRGHGFRVQGVVSSCTTGVHLVTGLPFTRFVGVGRVFKNAVARFRVVRTTFGVHFVGLNGGFVHGFGVITGTTISSYNIGRLGVNTRNRRVAFSKYRGVLSYSRWCHFVTLGSRHFGTS